MSKKILILLLGLCLILMATACGNSGMTSEPGGDGQTKPVTLKLAHFFPATHPAETDLIQPWAKAIHEATQGRVTIESYPGNTLTQADATYDAVISGITDLGLSCFSYTRGTFPVLEVFELPGITYVNSKAASRVAWEGIKELNPAEVRDTKLMMVFTTGPGDLYTKVPVRELKDLKGLEIRATGLSAQTLEVLGATPVAMAQSEAYESLSKGVVQGNLGPIEVLEGWRQAEVTKYITYTPFLYNTLFYITMNQNVWNSLSVEDRQAIEKLNDKFFNEVAVSLWDKQNESALKFAVEKNGLETITLPVAEQQKWIELIEPVQAAYVEKMNAAGQPGQEILDKVKALSAKYNEESKE
ncbi:MAG: TRAP transporter substrate-binding protein [Clostridia bacterium]|nr:TRAP transporter substrate-binding protein [Clostridia bacterium]